MSKFNRSAIWDAGFIAAGVLSLAACRYLYTHLMLWGLAAFLLGLGTRNALRHRV